MNHQMDYRTLRRAIFTKNLYNFSAFTTYLQDSARKISNVLYFFYSKMIMLIVVVFLFSRKFILKLLTRSLLFIVYYVHTISPGRCVLELSLASEDMQTKVTRLRFISSGGQKFRALVEGGRGGIAPPPLFEILLNKMAFFETFSKNF